MPHTVDRPKCMVDLFGKSMLERQIRVLSEQNVSEITVVTGHCAEAVSNAKIKTRHNADFASSNMVESLFAAKDILLSGDDVVVAYGDIVYQSNVLSSLLEAKADLAVCVDREWREYWQNRMEDPLADAETLKLTPDGRLTELGKKPDTYEDIQAQYIGLFKISAELAPSFVEFYEALDREAFYDGQPFKKMYMTSFLQALIDSGVFVRAVEITNGWLEVDSLDDLACYKRLHERGNLAQFYDLNG